ncbi:MAG: nucleotidyltransferase domain-containing protein [Planctomycetes bacterium]|nr:nucleotidyltransferase domain-containing protein [Planctomycetota bacterium]
MIPGATQAQIAALHELCRRFGVERLELFGSAATPRFEPERSDLDFAVTFQRECPPNVSGRFEQYFGFREGLIALFNRPVDLVEPHAIRNPEFRRAIRDTTRLLYAA